MVDHAHSPQNVTNVDKHETYRLPLPSLAISASYQHRLEKAQVKTGNIGNTSQNGSIKKYWKRAIL